MFKQRAEIYTRCWGFEIGTQSAFWGGGLNGNAGIYIEKGINSISQVRFSIRQVFSKYLVRIRQVFGTHSASI